MGSRDENPKKTRRARRVRPEQPQWWLDAIAHQPRRYSHRSKDYPEARTYKGKGGDEE